MRVKELMSRELVMIGPEESCLEAVRRMQRARVRHLPVVSGEGTIVGIVTDRDLRHHLFSPSVFERLGTTAVEGLLKLVRVSEVMTRDVLTIGSDASVGDAASTMRRRRVGSLPVVEAGRMVGIVTEIDVLRQILREDATCTPECAEVIVSYP